MRIKGNEKHFFSKTVPVVELKNSKAPWPKEKSRELGYEFKGYYLDTLDRPTFLYRYNDVVIEDYFIASKESESLLSRKLSLNSIKGNQLYFMAAMASRIKELGAGHYQIEESLKIKIEGAKGIIRDTEAGKELILRLNIKGGKSILKLDYSW